jgi:hypothetical protein
MIGYELESSLNFGKFKGSTIKEIAELEPSYLNWCAVNIDQFYLSEEVIDQIKELCPAFILSNEAISALNIKSAFIGSDSKEESIDGDEYEFDDERKTYENYRGSYAQDVEGWSDQDIDDVFGGDADAYWNID